MNHSIPPAKRAFDILVGTGMLLAVLPVLLLVIAAQLVLEGSPVFYRSRRRLDAGPAQPIVKFRTMRRDAERIANRDTVPILTTRFLNLPPTSPLYTPVGRVIEALMLTEMPQLLHVLDGRMSLIGNRPLPDNVVASLAEEFPDVEDRFLVRCGITGPVQLIGRDAISDAARLQIEAAYCRAVLSGYSPVLDFKILAFTVLAGFNGRFRFTAEDVLDLLARHGGLAAPLPAERRRLVAIPAHDPEDAAQPADHRAAPR